MVQSGSVSGREREVLADQILVSQTDLKGQIVDANQDFMVISGYGRDEIIGAPHNLVHHSDVPKGVFKDMWASIQAGKPWVQIVKNLCKSGDFFWLELNISPIVEQGQIVGYLSVGRRVSQNQKQQAEILFQQIKSGRMSIENGMPMTPARRMCLFNRIHPMTVMLFSIGVLGIALIAQSLGWVLPIYASLPIAAFALFYAFMGRRYILRRLGRVKHLVERMQQGDFSEQLDLYGHHSLTNVMRAVKKMQIQLGASYVEAKESLARNTRINVALDQASTAMMMVDSQGQIVYLNRALQALIDKYQTTLNQSLAGFDSTSLTQQTLNVFAPLLSFEDLKTEATQYLTQGDLVLQIQAQSVENQAGESLGYVLEWHDISQARRIETTLQNALDLASKGHTDIHLATENLDGFYRSTADHINSLLSSLNGTIEEMVKVMVSLASGNVKTRITKYLSGSLAAMKGATNVSLDSLSTILVQIKQVAQATSQAANESSQVAHDLSSRTQQAAATLQQINATMQTITQLQSQNVEALHSATGQAKQSLQKNESASEVMQASVEAMNSIKQTSDKISDIIGLIDGIAFQTNLLALNAAVEAARAGDHGRGFAVVAGEVRQLAQKSAEAANDIKALILQAGEKVSEGSEKVQQTHDAFKEIHHSVEQMTGTLMDVSQSINEQQTSVREVAQAISTLDDNIQNNAALVEQTSAASESLRDQANILNHQVQSFEVDERFTQQARFANSEVYGIKLGELRQQMRIWRAKTQAYLNGIQIELDLAQMTQPQVTALGQALVSWAQADAHLAQTERFQDLQRLQNQMHDYAKLVMECRELKDGYPHFVIEKG
jgi:methyl-accepting chemotaxis protein